MGPLRLTDYHAYLSLFVWVELALGCGSTYDAKDFILPLCTMSFCRGHGKEDRTLLKAGYWIPEPSRARGVNPCVRSSPFLQDATKAEVRYLESWCLLASQLDARYALRTILVGEEH